MTYVYIAGPMTGIANKNFPAFLAAEAVLVEMGYGVHNPARKESEDLDLPYEQYMAQDALLVDASDAVVLLPGWVASQGANREVAQAQMQHKPVFELIDGELVPL